MPISIREFRDCITLRIPSPRPLTSRSPRPSMAVTPVPSTIPASRPRLGPYTQENVYTMVAPAVNSQYFIPNLPNTSGQHNGLTGNIYFMGDPFIGKPGYWPDTSVWPFGTFHLTLMAGPSTREPFPSLYLVLLDQSGGAGSTYIIYQSTPALRNLWKHTIQGYDYISSDPTNHPADPAYYTVQRIS